jgi:hypothetical protein
MTPCAVAAAFLVLALGFAWFSYRKAAAVGDELASLSQKQAVLNAGIQEDKGRIASAQQDRQQLLASVKKLRLAPRNGGGAAAMSNPRTRLIATNPTLLDLYLKSFRGMLSMRYGPYYQQAGLSADQIAKFEDLLTRHEEDNMDLIATAVSQGLSASDPSIASVRRQQNRQFQADQTALLGDSDSQQLQQFNREQAALAQVKGAAYYALSTAPFTSAQVGQVTQILANSSPNFQLGGDAAPPSIDWDSAMSQAATVLSPAQLTALNAQAQLAKVGKLMNSYFSQPKSK